MLSILVNNGSFLGHLTSHGIAKSVRDGGVSNQAAMASHAQLSGMFLGPKSSMGSILIPTDQLHASCIMTIFATDQDSVSQIQETLESHLREVIL